MTRLERLAIWALLTLWFCGCTHTVEIRSESAVQATAAIQERASSTLDEVVQTGPETVTTTVEEYGVGSVAEGAAPSSDPAANKHREQGAILPAAHILVKRTITVDQRGPILDTRRQTAAEASSATQTVKSEEKSTAKTKTAPALSGYVWMALAALVVAAIGWVAWKLSPLSKIL